MNGKAWEVIWTWQYYKIFFDTLKYLINEQTRIKEERFATLLVYFLSKTITKYGGIFSLLHEKLRVWWIKKSKKAK